MSFASKTGVILLIHKLAFHLKLTFFVLLIDLTNLLREIICVGKCHKPSLVIQTNIIIYSETASP